MHVQRCLLKDFYEIWKVEIAKTFVDENSLLKYDWGFQWNIMLHQGVYGLTEKDIYKKLEIDTVRKELFITLWISNDCCITYHIDSWHMLK